MTPPIGSLWINKWPPNGFFIERIIPKLEYQHEYPDVENIAIYARTVASSKSIEIDELSIWTEADFYNNHVPAFDYIFKLQLKELLSEI